MHDGYLSEAARDFVEEFATLLAATGLPRMTARAFACLLIADGLTSADLVRRLGVSSASVSKSIGYLEGMALVLRRPDPTGRRERYAIDDGAWLRAWRADTDAHGRIASAARRASASSAATPRLVPGSAGFSAGSASRWAAATSR